jgi:hypothetical protein
VAFFLVSIKLDIEYSEKADWVWGWEAVVVMAAYPFIAAKGVFGKSLVCFQNYYSSKESATLKTACGQLRACHEAVGYSFISRPLAVKCKVPGSRTARCINARVCA